MAEQHETVIVGGGHAGLAMSYHLSRRGCPHVVLERARLAERWRSERWDSLRFQFPNWSLALPGQPYDGDDPEGFASRDEVVAFIERYAAAIAAPVRTGVRVDALRAAPGPGERLRLETSEGALEAAYVVVATGPYQVPVIPAWAGALPAGLVQLHSSAYRNRRQLPRGAVLVVGSGASGCQIVEYLHAPFQTVILSVGRHRRFPRRYRGRDVFWWLERMGALDRTREEQPEARERANPLVTGAGGGHDIDLRLYQMSGILLVGRVEAVEGTRLRLADDLAARSRRRERDRVHPGRRRLRGAHRSRRAAGAAGRPTGAAPPAPGPDHRPGRAGGRRRDLGHRFRRDFGWIDLPVLDDRGEPIHRRGVTEWPGLYFLGLPWLHTLKSSVLCGAGRDAEYLAEHVASAAAAGAPGRA